MTNLLKHAAARNDIIEISNEKLLISDDAGKIYECRRLELKNSFIVYYITEKMYQKMIEFDIIVKVE